MVRSSCPECHKTLCNQYSVARHVLQCHLKVRRFICNVCQKALSSKQYLLMHYEKHERQEARSEILNLSKSEPGPDEPIVKAEIESALDHEKRNYPILLTYFKLGSYTESVEVKDETGCSGEFIRLPPISWRFMSQEAVLPSVFQSPASFGSFYVLS